MSDAQVNYSQFAPSSLLEILHSKYDLPENAVCIFFKSGLNDVYKITAVDTTYFLRISLHGAHSMIEIREEIDVILHLRSCGLSVVEPIPCRDSSFVWEIEAPEGFRQVVLFRGIDQNPSGLTVDRMGNLGAATAKMHLAVNLSKCSTSRPLIDEKMLVQEPVALLTPFLQHRSEDMDFLNRTAKDLWLQAESLLSSHEDVMGFCHGDIQPNNFFFDGDKPIIFDFDCMGVGYFAYDLGVLLANLTFIDNEIYGKPLWNALIDGYCIVRPLHDDEIRAIYIFAALHMLRVLAFHAKMRETVSGAFYFMTDVHLNTYFGAYKRLTILACEKADLNIL